MKQHNSGKILVISGPTASGKSYLAEELLKQYTDSIILNADSMQIYKDLPILSGQPNIQKKPDIYKLYGFLDFYENYSVGLWQEAAYKIIMQAFENKKFPIIVGGTGLYIKALLEGIADIPEISSNIRQHVQKQFLKLGKENFYSQLASFDPISTKKIHINDSYRMQRAMEVYLQTGRSIANFKISKSSYITQHISILPNRNTLYRNCNLRLQKMLAAGAKNEVASLLNKIQNKPGKYNIENTFGYRNIVSYLKGESNLEEAIAEASQATRNYAKRQYTWFKNQFSNKISLSYDLNIAEIQEEFFKLTTEYFNK